jgi:poly(3-hydroxybutyrate) depolymerase
MPYNMNNYKKLTTNIITIFFLTSCGGNKPVEEENVEQSTNEPVETKIESSVFGTEFKSLSPGKNDIQFDHKGQSRHIIVTTPETFDDQIMYPALFCFHGAGGTAKGPSKRWSPHVDKRGMIVFSMEAIQPQSKWNFKDDFHEEEYDDVAYVSELVNSLIASKVVEPKAIYATGHSSGGLFCYRLAKETDLFAALSPMSCGMAKDAHEPDEETKLVSMMQVIGDQDKSFNGSTTKRVTMYSAEERIAIWRTFIECLSDPVVMNKGEVVEVFTYTNASGIEVAYCKVKGEGHHIKRDLRDRADSFALDFLLKHKKN